MMIHFYSLTLRKDEGIVRKQYRLLIRKTGAWHSQDAARCLKIVKAYCFNRIV